MTRALLEHLRDRSAFDPAPRHSELHDVHVPFDILTGNNGCEQALLDALRRGERVALVGSSGAGKSSVIAATLGPLVEGIFPIPIPVAVERAEVARDQTEFVRHLVRNVSRILQEGLPHTSSAARQIEAQSRVPSELSKRHRVSATLPLPAGVAPELAYELQKVATAPAQTSAEVLEQGREILALISDDDLVPILVLDDTDRWLAGLRPDSDALRRDFFSMVPRLLATDLAVAAVIAVHPTYLTDPAYQAARGFLSTTIRVPAAPSSGALAQILGRRIANAHEDQATHAPMVDDVFTAAAVRHLYQHYTSAPSDVRRNVLLIAHTALSLALDDGAEKIDDAHIGLALTS